MKKSHYRDYATEGFRFLAREKSAAEYTQRIWNEELARQTSFIEGGGGISKPTESAALRAEAAVKAVAAELADLEAAEWALEALERTRGRIAVKVVRAVYMVAPEYDLARGDIHQRVIAVSLAYHVCERTVYGILSKARSLFAERRGLRL